jgi:hypothetical protein
MKKKEKKKDNYDFKPLQQHKHHWLQIYHTHKNKKELQQFTKRMISK